MIFQFSFSLKVTGGRKRNSCGNIENNLLAEAEDACIVAYRDVDLMAKSPNEDELLFISLLLPYLHTCVYIRTREREESDVYAGSTNLLIGI